MILLMFATGFRDQKLKAVVDYYCECSKKNNIATQYFKIYKLLVVERLYENNRY